VKLTTNQIETILQTAISYIGHPYSAEFCCVDFVRKVYDSVGIKIPKLRSYSPPAEFNIKKEDLAHPPVGHLMFLKDRSDPRQDRAWTHVVIIMPDLLCIHCSLFFGEKVVISPLLDIFKKYDFVDSNTA